MRGTTVLEHYKNIKPYEYNWDKLKKVSFYVPYKGKKIEYKIANKKAVMPTEDEITTLKELIIEIKEEVKGKGEWKKLYNALKKYSNEKKIDKLEEVVNDKNAEEIAKTLINEVKKYELKNKPAVIIKLLEVANWKGTEEVRKKIQETTGSEQVEWIRTYWEDSIKEQVTQGKIKIGKKIKGLINNEINNKLANIKAIKTGAGTEGVLRIELSEGEITDLIKGSISSDCTTNFKTAFGHFKDPYTLNFKIYKGRDWIGNIYAAVTKEKETGKEVLLIDAIQFSTTSEITKMKTKDLDELADNILESLNKWAGDKFDAVALGRFGSERGRLKQYLQQKRGIRKTEVEKLGEQVYLASLRKGSFGLKMTGSARVIWEKAIEEEQEKEAEKIISQLIKYSNNPIVSKEIQKMVGKEVEKKLEEIKNTVVLSFIEEFTKEAIEQSIKMGKIEKTKLGDIPEKAKLFIPDFLAQEFKKMKTPESRKKAVLKALDYLIEAKERTDKDVIEKYYKIAEKAFSNALALTEKGLVLDVRGVQEKVHELLREQFEKMKNYMKTVEKETKEKKETVYLFPDKEVEKKINELSFLPDEVIEEFMKNPKLLEDYEVEQAIKKVVELFFKPIPWHEKIKNHLDEIINPMIIETATQIALKEKIEKEPQLKQKIKKLIEKEEE